MLNKFPEYYRNKKMKFESERLIIRKAIARDALDIFENYAQDSDVTKYLTWSPHTHLQQTQEWIEYCIKNAYNEKGIKLVVFKKEEQQVIGMVDFNFENYQTDFGYVLAKKYWNQGIITEAMKPVIDFVYKMPNIFRIWATHDIDNAASGKVMEKLGLEYEGILRKSLMHPNISDKPRDGKYYSLIK